MSETLLDQAHGAMSEAPDDDALRLRFFERFADAELLLLLEAPAEGDQIAPQIFPVEEGQFVLVFDQDDRLSAFAEKIAPKANMSGRTLVKLLKGKGLGVGLNLGVAPSSFLIPANAIDWLADILADAPKAVEARPEDLSAPIGLPEALIAALDAKLPATAGLARYAYLAGATYEGGRKGHLLAFIDPFPGAEVDLAQAAKEALTFSGVEAGVMDVGFFAASDPISATLARVALRFDLPELSSLNGQTPPGSDPKRPPQLR